MKVRIKLKDQGVAEAVYHAVKPLLALAIEEGILVARAIVPVDTSSLQESIRMNHIDLEGPVVSAKLIAGGEDYSSTIMKSTGKQGNLVDYALEQEILHGFISSAIPTIIDRLNKPDR